MKSTATLQLNKAHWPVTVLGPGRRIGLWVQGCAIHCRGCVSQDTWPADPAKAMPVRDIVAWCKRVSGDALDGVGRKSDGFLSKIPGATAAMDKFGISGMSSGQMFAAGGVAIGTAAIAAVDQTPVAPGLRDDRFQVAHAASASCAPTEATAARPSSTAAPASLAAGASTVRSWSSSSLAQA